MDYYIGSLLLWAGKKENYTALSCEAMIRVPVKRDFFMGTS